MEGKLEQFSNASCSILLTLLGIVIEVRPEQFWNANFSILTTLEGILISVRSSSKLDTTDGVQRLQPRVVRCCP